jgi:leucyl/phenylalanyl-tRNA--protein transferase
MVLLTKDFKLHRSLRKTLQQFMADVQCEIRINHDFSAVIRHCAQTSRKGQPGTWIVEEMILAYEALHGAGFVHSVETWRGGQLVGGLYCVSIGNTLFGESMFALLTDASKIALAALVAFARAHELPWIDCQQKTPHLASLGAHEMPRADFLKQVRGAPKDVSREWLFDPTYWQTLLSARSPL